MPQTLYGWHIPYKKVGEILCLYMDVRDMSTPQLARLTGITEDTIKNIRKNKNQDIKLEQMIKFCAALLIPPEVFVQLIFEGSDVDFADKILLYSPLHDKVIPSTQVPLSNNQEIIPASVAEVVASDQPSSQSHRDLHQMLVPLDTEMYTRNELQAVLDRVSHCHEHHMSDMRTQAERQHELICKLIDKG